LAMVSSASGTWPASAWTASAPGCCWPRSCTKSQSPHRRDSRNRRCQGCHDSGRRYRLSQGTYPSPKW
jgi:hypothetical protein